MNNSYFSFPGSEIVDCGQMQKSGIYVKSNTLMQRIVEDPNEAEALLQVFLEP